MGSAALLSTFTTLLILAAIVLALWALFSDRSRGRRRCPKCWYDLSGTTTLLCSECGFRGKRERSVHRTRRRWRWVVVALAIAAGSLSFKMRDRGWVSLVPTTVLVVVMPHLDHSAPNATRFVGGHPVWSQYANPLYRELLRRTDEGTLWHWQHVWLTRTLIENHQSPFKLDVQLPPNWPVDTPVCGRVIYRWVPRPLALSPVRARVEARLPDGAEWVGRREGARRGPRPMIVVWSDPTQSFGMVETGPNLVTFDVTFERRDSKGRWRPLWRGQIHRSVTGQGAHDAYVRPDALHADASPFGDAMVVVRPDCVSISRFSPGYVGLVAIRAEVLLADQVIRTTRAWWVFTSPSQNLVEHRLSWDVPLTEDEVEDETEVTVRLTADPEFALRALNQHYVRELTDHLGLSQPFPYWSGEMVIPTVIRSRR